MGVKIGRLEGGGKEKGVLAVEVPIMLHNWKRSMAAVHRCGHTSIHDVTSPKP